MSPVERTVTVRSLGELIKVIADETLSQNQTFWYRGQHCSKWGLVPSIYRQARSAQDTRLFERHLAHTFRSRAGMRHGHTPSFEDIPGWISLMQHYGVPTRLLDWSRSPLIACYFAIERYLYESDVEPVDACVWALDPYTLNTLQQRGDFTVTIDSGKCRDLIEGAFYHDGGVESAIIQAVMASETDIRMFVQQGAFTIHNTPKPLNELPLNGSPLTKIILVAANVRTIANELAVCGFRKGDIYPDLQNLARDLSSFHIA
jgi:hypothetical protein